MSHKNLKISDAERKLILESHNGAQNSHVMTMNVSVDGKYMVVFDNLMDLRTNKNLGNIWENKNAFNIIVEHLFNLNPNPEHREYINESKVIQDIWYKVDEVKLFVRENINSAENLITEGFWDWVSDKAGKAWEGIKSVGSMVGKGILWLLRKLRSFLYHPVGIALDIVLTATGIGKLAPMIMWAGVVCLDIYEILSGDYAEEDKNLPMWARLLFLAVDCLALVFTGAVSKTVRVGVESALTGAKGVSSILTKFPKLASFLKGFTGFLSRITGPIKTFLEWVGRNIPATSKFVAKISSGMDRVFAQLGEVSIKHQQTAYQQAAKSASKQLGRDVTQQELKAAAKQQVKKGVKQAAVATGVIGAAHLGLSAFSGDEEETQGQEMSNTTPEENKMLAQQFTNTMEQDPEFEKLKQELSQ
jgi:hypothetical protein